MKNLKKFNIIICTAFCLLSVLLSFYTLSVSAVMHTDLNMVAVDTDYNIHTLNSLPNGTKDIYDSNNNVLVKNTNTIILNGSESGWWVGSVASPNRKQRFNLPVADCALFSSVTDYIMISDKFNTTNDFLGSSEEHVIAGHNETGLIRLSSIITADMTLAEFITWLSQNPVTVVYQLKEPQEILLLSGGYIPITDVYKFIAEKNQGFLSSDNTNVTADLTYLHDIVNTEHTLYNVNIKNSVLYNYYNMDFKNSGQVYEHNNDYGTIETVKLYINFVKPFYFRDDIFVYADSDVSYIEFTDTGNKKYVGEIDYETGRLIFDDVSVKNYSIKKIYIHVAGAVDRFYSLKVSQDNYTYKFGYDYGYINGHSSGFSDGIDKGYNNGYTAGVNASTGEYQRGYSDGFGQTGILGIVSTGFDTIDHVLQIEIFPNIRLWYLVALPLLFGFITLFMKFLG